MPTEGFVGELTVFNNKGKKEKLYASFHPQGRILEENNDSGHWRLMGRHLGQADILKQSLWPGTRHTPFLFILGSFHWSITICLEGLHKKKGYF